MFPRALRLRRSHDIITTLRRGKRTSRGALSCTVMPGKPGESRITVIVDKKVSKLAVVRNLVKRRIRAALKEQGLPIGDVVVRAHPGSQALSYQEICQQLKLCLPARSS